MVVSNQICKLDIAIDRVVMEPSRLSKVKDHNATLKEKTLAAADVHMNAN